ncbi:MAG: nucleotidyltransferase domain-containing protein [Bacteroidetes bacterium]|nr:nucleotidyltransferase domain-containing protein [Bacteroidota bacterium]
MRGQAVNTITEVTAELGFRVEKIILFGSRARGEARAESDWDFPVVLNDDLTFAGKLELIVQVERRLAAMRIPTRTRYSNNPLPQYSIFISSTRSSYTSRQ